MKIEDIKENTPYDCISPLLQKKVRIVNTEKYLKNKNMVDNFIYNFKYFTTPPEKNAVILINNRFWVTEIVLNKNKNIKSVVGYTVRSGRGEGYGSLLREIDITTFLKHFEISKFERTAEGVPHTKGYY